MPAESAEVRTTRLQSRHKAFPKRPWYRANIFLFGVLFLLILYAVFLLPVTRHPSPIQWASVIFFFFITLAWVASIITDVEKPTWVGALVAIGLVITFGWLFYRYSGAQWDRLIFVFFNRRVMAGKGWSSLFKSLGVTMELGFLAAIFAVLSGLFLAIVRSLNNRVLNLFIVFHIDIFRAIPTIVLAALVYYALPYVGIQLPGILAGVITLSLTHGAYSSEIFRAGIESIHHGQIEAARSLGFNSLKTMRLVILPQAFRVVVPPLTGQMVALLKETSICSTIGILELLRQALILQAWKANPTPLIAATFIYLLLLIPLTRLSKSLEVKMKKGRAGS